jgi:hypothetical protein
MGMKVMVLIISSCCRERTNKYKDKVDACDVYNMKCNNMCLFFVFMSISFSING